MRGRLLGCFVGLALSMSPTCLVWADTTSDVRTVFERFIAAQNAHDLAAVGPTLIATQGFLWITAGAPVWGRDAALQEFANKYKGTWHLEPKMDELKITELAPGVARLFVPATFTIAPEGQTATPRKWLLTQTYTRTADGWRISTILPIPLPP